MASNGGAAGAGATASSGADVPTAPDLFHRAKAIMAETGVAVDALSAFMAARAELESSYAKSLAKLSKQSLNVAGEQRNFRCRSSNHQRCESIHSFRL